MKTLPSQGAGQLNTSWPILHALDRPLYITFLSFQSNGNTDYVGFEVSKFATDTSTLADGTIEVMKDIATATTFTEYDIINAGMLVIIPPGFWLAVRSYDGASAARSGTAYYSYVEL